MKKILLGFILFLPIIASATNFPQSGIDYDISTMTITGPAGATCLNQSIFPGHGFSLTDLGFADGTFVLNAFGNWSVPAQRCFQANGEYALVVNLIDKAGNSFALPQEDFLITSDTPDEPSSSFAVACSNAVANNDDTCVATLRLRDQFGNDVEQTLEDIELYSPTDDFIDDANLALTQFRGGLRIGASNFTSSNRLPFDWDMAALPTLYIKALAPSIRKVPVLGNTLSTVVNRTIDFAIDNISEINIDGTVSTTATTDFSELPATLRFDVPIEIVPGFEQATITLGEGDDIDMNNVLDVSSPGAIESVTSNFTSISGHLFMPPEDGGPLNQDVIFSTVAEDEKKIITRKIHPENQYSTPGEISLITIANYFLGDKLIRYPAGAIGEPLADALTNIGYEDPFPSIIGWNEVGVGMKNIGVSIEGTVVGDAEQMYLVGGDDNDITALASLGFMDIREEIVKNAYQLIRNATDIKTDVATFDFLNDFSGKDVVVYDLSELSGEEATLQLNTSTLPAGKKTLIVLNGNVFINGDLTYDTPATDSFGLILIRDAAGPEPLLGNIFVGPDTQEINGTLFADGGFFSGDTSGSTFDPAALLLMANTDFDTDVRAKQLLLRGTALIKGTVGGARMTNGGEYFTPWGMDAARTIPMRYDLHYVRRYDFDENPNFCVGGTGNCDPNDAAFIFRVDGKMALAAPPGFRTQNTH